MSKAITDYGLNLFSKSMITTKFLQHHKIDMKVKDFKEYILTQPYEVVAVGGYNYNHQLKLKHIKVWDINQIKYRLTQKDL